MSHQLVPENALVNLEKPVLESRNLLLDRLLVIGVTGLVGSRLASLADRYGFETFATQNSRISNFPRASQLDITDREATVRLVSSVRPDTIVNAAAVTNVDYCETHRVAAEKVNTAGARNLADASLKNHCRLIQISTDSVFDGTKGNYAETDPPHPINYYSVTKLEAERVVCQLPNFAIARASAVYGWHLNVGREFSESTKAMNFAMFVLTRLQKDERVQAITDQWNCPTWVDDLAQALLKLARHRENGIYHTAGRSCLSRYEFAVRLAQEFGYSTKLVQPVTTRDLRQLAKRPKNSCLNVEKTERALGMQFMTADAAFAEMKKQSIL